MFSHTFYDVGVGYFADRLVDWLNDAPENARLPVELAGDTVECPIYSGSARLELVEAGGGRVQRLVKVDVEAPDELTFDGAERPAILSGIELTADERRETFENLPVETE